MSRDDFIGTAVFIGLIGLGIYYFSKPEPLKPVVGRYEIEKAGQQTFLLDTSNGDTWRFVWADLEGKGKPTNWYWEKTDILEKPTTKDGWTVEQVKP